MAFCDTQKQILLDAQANLDAAEAAYQKLGMGKGRQSAARRARRDVRKAQKRLKQCQDDEAKTAQRASGGPRGTTVGSVVSEILSTTSDVANAIAPSGTVRTGATDRSQNADGSVRYDDPPGLPGETSPLVLAGVGLAAAAAIYLILK